MDWGKDHRKKNRNLEEIAVLETQIDDLTPQVIGYLFDVLLTAGALDVFTQSVTMKKSRPGILLTVICPVDKVSVCEEILFRETTTLGIRQRIQTRSILDREIQTVQIKYGTVRVKIASQGKGDEKVIINRQPEYEDCAVLARQFNQPLRHIQQLALDALYNLDSR